jgi:hypothetical protein
MSQPKVYGNGFGNASGVCAQDRRLADRERAARNNRREGKAWSKPVQTVINGVPFGRPYPSPFSAR